MSEKFDYQSVTKKKQQWDIQCQLEGGIDYVIAKLIEFRDNNPDEKLSIVFEDEIDYDGSEYRRPYLMTTRLETFLEYSRRIQMEQAHAEQVLIEKRAYFKMLKEELGEK